MANAAPVYITITVQKKKVKKMFCKMMSLMIFSIGIAAMGKYYEFSGWLSSNPWLAFPMIVIGGFGICMLFRGDD